jgi:hypothetical protein
VRKIIHVDMDDLYASVEQRDKPQLRGKPFIAVWQSKRSVVCGFGEIRARARFCISTLPRTRLRDNFRKAARLIGCGPGLLTTWRCHNIYPRRGDEIRFLGCQ